MQLPWKPSSKITAATLLIALGIIYGDIGYKPTVYVLKAIVEGEREINETLTHRRISSCFGHYFSRQPLNMYETHGQM
jgi:K+ transporter